MKKLALLLSVAMVFGLSGAVASAGDTGGQSMDGTQYTTPQDHGAGRGAMPGDGTEQGTAPTQRSSNNVVIQNFTFTPANITVPMGTTVRWTNRDSAPHTVTGDTSGGPMSGTLEPGESYSFTFSKGGTYNYHCTIHPMMTGTVTVTGSAPARVPTPTQATPPTTTNTPTSTPSSTDTGGSGMASNTNTNTNTNTMNQNVTVNETSSQTSSAKPAATTPTATPAPSQPTTTNTAPAATPAAAVAATQTPSELPNTGAGGVVAAFVATTILGSGLYYLYARRKMANNS